VTKQKKISITIAFLGNANYDTRVTNLADSLTADGVDVKIISFDWKTPGFTSVSGNRSVFKLTKKKNPFGFYLNFIIILFKELLKTKSSIYFAEDIQTLPIVTFIAKLRKAKVYYNSREFYAFLAGLRNKPKTQTVIRMLEKFFINKVDKVLVTGEKDAEFLTEYYGLSNIVVIRNLPSLKRADAPMNFREMLNISADKTILLYQGVILEGRGLEPLLKAMQNVKMCELVILGDGEFKTKYEQFAVKLKIEKRVHFLGNIEQKKLINYTAAADIGVALIENISKSYYYALPNKLFEYIMAELPVLVSNLPQMKKITEEYQVGYVVDLEQDNLTDVLKKITENKYNLIEYKENCIKAKKELNWEKEYEKVKHLLIG